MELEIVPATAERWADLENLFGPRGGSNGCWCMFWRLKRKDFSQNYHEGNHAAMKELTCSNTEPGLLAYDGELPVGWISIGPREDFLALENSRTLKRIDDQPVWSIVCFYINRKYRRKGVMSALIHGAVTYAAGHGARIIEAYPLDMHSNLLEGKKLTGYTGYMGIASAFEKEGFIKVAEASESQVIMRYSVAGAK